ncbi:MAG: RidA family protein [Spirochaetaceae bacterium]
MRTVHTSDAPDPGGHYAQGQIHGSTLYVSGQLPVEPGTGEKLAGGIEAQTRRVLANVLAVVRAAGGDLTSIVKTTVYVSDIALWNTVDSVYAEFFGEHKPARAVVPTKELHFGFQIEMEAVAELEE